MKIILAGAYGRLGLYLLRGLLREGHEVIAADIRDEEPEVASEYEFEQIDVTKKDTLEGLCDGVDCVISAIGLMNQSTLFNNYDIDFLGNAHLLDEAKKSRVKHFAYISALGSGMTTELQRMHAKNIFERKLQSSGISYTIFRPTVFFENFVESFREMVNSGEVTFYGTGKGTVNAVAPKDLANFIIDHFDDENEIYSVGGSETYSYEDVAKMCFEAAGRTAVIKYTSEFGYKLKKVKAVFNKNKMTDSLRDAHWMQSQKLIASTICGESSLKQFIQNNI